MVRFLKYIQYFITIALILGLAWLIVNKANSIEGSISSLEFALRMAKDNRAELDKVLCFYQKNLADSLKYKAADRKSVV